MRITTAHAVSLGLNGVLIALVVAQWSTRTAPRVNPSVPAGARAPAGFETTTARAVTMPKRVQIGTGWQQWIEPLRAAGVPAEVLVGLVRSDFDQRWRARQSEMQQKFLRGQVDTDALAALALDHDAQLEIELRSALGADEFRRWDMTQVLQSLNVGQVQMSDPERDAVYDLERGLLDNLRTTQAERLRGTIDQATLNSREQTEQEAVTEKLRAILGEQRAAQLQGSDDTLGNLKRGLSSVPLTDAQWYALADVQRNWDQTRSQLTELQNHTGNPAYAEAIQQAEEKWRADFLRIAGPDAMDQYLKSQDSRYVDLQRFGANWLVPPDEIEGIYDAVANFDEIVHAYGLDAMARDVDPAVARATAQQYQQKTARELQQQLGSNRYAELKRNGIVP